MGEFTSEEREIINSISRSYQADIDLANVAEILISPDFSPYDIHLEMLENPKIHRKMSADMWAAIAVRRIRDIDNQSEEGHRERLENLMQIEYIALNGTIACSGLQLIKDVDEFWRFKPIIEKIFELDGTELEKSEAYAKAYTDTTFEDSVQPHKKSLIQNYRSWDKSELSTENIKQAKEIYESCFKIFEVGFPNLLALKRILDGEAPDLKLLQNKSASSVRRELTEDNPESNSVYFDIIVNNFDSDLRNGIAHNDIVTNPPESLIQIPTRNKRYSYERFNEIVKANFATGVFLTGTFLSLLEWHAITNDVSDREERPDWVFEDSSIPENWEMLPNG